VVDSISESFSQLLHNKPQKPLDIQLDMFFRRSQKWTVPHCAKYQPTDRQVGLDGAGEVKAEQEENSTG